MKKIFLIALILFFLTGNAFAAGSSVTQTYAIVGSNTGMATLTLEWTSDDATGEVSAATSTANTEAITGKYIAKVKCIPGSGATQPTDLYDVTLTDADSQDVMGGTLANRTNAAGGDMAVPLVGAVYGGAPITGALTVNVTNAGNSKTGKIVIYLSR